MRAFLKDYTPVADKLYDAGMKLHYHNHGFEYEQFENKCLLDWMAEETDPEKWGFILDVYWTQFGGRSPSRQIIIELGDRIDVIHFKDMKMHGHEHRFAAVMDGNLDFDAILDACREVGIQYDDDRAGRLLRPRPVRRARAQRKEPDCGRLPLLRRTDDGTQLHFFRLRRRGGPEFRPAARRTEAQPASRCLRSAAWTARACST